MSFVSRFEALIERRGAESLSRLWRNTCWFSLGIFVFCVWYLQVTESGTFPVTINKALADSAMILIGFSFAFSGLCYFWDFVDTKIIYRKHLGLAGFAFALAHGVMSSIFYFWYKPHGYETSPIFQVGYQWDFGSFFVSNLYALAAAIVALSIFTMMALISNRYALNELGGLWWRRLLRVGYLAYISAAIHFLIKNIPEWRALLLSSGTHLPPLNFLIFLLVLGVVGLRLALWYVLTKKQSSETPSL